MRQNNSKQTIMQCALKLFSEKGYEGTSPNKIVEMAGIKKPTLYYFFGSKEGLLDELLKVNYGNLDARIESECIYTPNNEDYEHDVFPALLRVVNAYFRFAEENTDFYLMVLAMNYLPVSSKTALISEQYRKNQTQILYRLFEQISAVHHNLKGKEQIYSLRFLALINAQVGYWSHSSGDLSNDTARSIVTGFMHGIFS